jgi:hypothetical protein
MPPADRAVALIERSESPCIEDLESALRWLGEFVGELRRQRPTVAGLGTEEALRVD